MSKVQQGQIQHIREEYWLYLYDLKEGLVRWTVKYFDEMLAVMHQEQITDQSCFCNLC